VAQTDPQRDCRVLVTGGAGFIGSHAIDRLVAGCEVDDFQHWAQGQSRMLAIGGSRSSWPTSWKDLPRQLAGAGFDAILDLTARASAARSLEDSLGDLRVSCLSHKHARVHALQLADPATRRFT
jgi:nucleoside-diphosphate-sugar epimerase